MSELSRKEFLASVINYAHPKLVSNSWGVYDYYKYYRKNKPEGKKYVMKEAVFYKLIRRVNQLLADELVENHSLELPYRMGELKIYYEPTKSYIKDGKVKTNRVVDWDETLKLWYEDDQMRKEKRLIYRDLPSKIRFRYDRSKAKFANYVFYEMRLGTELKTRICKSFHNQLPCFDNFEIKNLYNG